MVGLGYCVLARLDQCYVRSCVSRQWDTTAQLNADADGRALVQCVEELSAGGDAEFAVDAAELGLHGVGAHV